MTVSPEQVISWAPDTIITLEPGFRDTVGSLPAWQPVPAVSANRVFLVPGNPFGFVDFPPSVNRLIGLTWLLHKLYPDQVEGDLHEEVREFYRLFYHVELNDAEVGRLLVPLRRFRHVFPGPAAFGKARRDLEKRSRISGVRGLTERGRTGPGRKAGERSDPVCE